jgi:UPF0716 protein FxsA
MWLGIAALLVVLDLYIVFGAAQRFGVCPTLTVLMLVGAAGSQLVRLSGMRMVRSFQESLARGEPPPEGVLEGLLLFAAGIAFAVPGVLSDALAFALLVPHVRRWIAGRLRARLEGAIANGSVRVVGFGSASTVDGPPIDLGARRPHVIDVEGADVTPHDDRSLPP